MRHRLRAYLPVRVAWPTGLPQAQDSGRTTPLRTAVPGTSIAVCQVPFV